MQSQILRIISANILARIEDVQTRNPSLVLRTNPLHLATHIARISQWSSFRFVEELTGTRSAGNKCAMHVAGLSKGTSLDSRSSTRMKITTRLTLPRGFLRPGERVEETKVSTCRRRARTHARTHSRTYPHCTHFFRKYDTLNKSSVLVQASFAS